MRIQLSDHFTYRRLLRFTMSTVLMLVCTSMYSIVDGFFVSNYVGKTAFAATNLIWPVSMGIAALGFMLGTGGSAVAAKTIGERKKELANQYFSMILYTALIMSLVLSALCFVFTPQIAHLLGADEKMLEDCVVYGRILFIFQTAFIFQNMFQSFLVAAEKPSLSLKINIVAGLMNVVFDYLFIAVFQWGVAGEDGVAAFGVIMYVNFIFMAVFMGYSIGSAPVVSYHYGAENHAELKNLCRKSLILMTVGGVVLTLLAELFAVPLVRIFVSYDRGLMDMTVQGFRLFSFAFLIMGLNVWGSSFFTALNNGVVSAAISFLRTFAFQVAAVLILPALLGIAGVWIAVPAAEGLAVVVTIAFLIKERKKYNY